MCIENEVTKGDPGWTFDGKDGRRIGLFQDKDGNFQLELSRNLEENEDITIPTALSEIENGKRHTYLKLSKETLFHIAHIYATKFHNK